MLMFSLFHLQGVSSCCQHSRALELLVDVLHLLHVQRGLSQYAPANAQMALVRSEEEHDATQWQWSEYSTLNFVRDFKPLLRFIDSRCWPFFTSFQVRLTTTQAFTCQKAKLAVPQFQQQHSTSGFVTGNGRSSSIWCPLLPPDGHPHYDTTVAV